MALTIVKKLPNQQPDVIGGFSWMQVADITFDSSYNTGGEALTRTDLGFPPDSTVVFLNAEPSSGYVFRYDRSAATLMVYVPGIAFGAAGALTIDDFPLSGTGATATSIGLASTATSPVRFGPLQEVASTTNLASITTRIVAVAAIV